jgi:dienelactone hydrolase
MSHDLPTRNGPKAMVVSHRALRIPAAGVTLDADLDLPDAAVGLVLFAHGSGSSRYSPRNRHVAQILNQARLATVLTDLLTADEEAVDDRTRHLRFDIELLAGRLVAASDWLSRQDDTAPLSIGLFGASTGGAAALVAAAERPGLIRAVVSRGGRPDLAGESLAQGQAATLLIVGGDDVQVIVLNRRALARLTGDNQLIIVPGAGHLFEEPGTLDTVAELTRDWFTRHLAATG